VYGAKGASAAAGNTTGGGGGGSGTVTSIATTCGTSGGTITTSGTISGSETVNLQTGAGAYAIQQSDCGQLVSRNQASAVSDTIAQAGIGGNFASGWYTDYQCRGAGGCTITPTTSTIDGGSSVVLTQNQGLRIASDGTNYFTQRGVGKAGTVTSVATTCGTSGGTITGSGTISGSETVNSQTGSSPYAIQQSDCGQLISRNQSLAVLDTIAQAGSGGNFLAGYYFDYQCRGTGGCTITPTTSTIDGASSLAFTQNTGARIASDGSNYFTQRGMGSGSVNLGIQSPIAATFTGSGTALASGTTPGVSLSYIPPLPFGCTAVAWTVTVDTGTAGFRVWRVAAGTAVPTVSNTITTADLAISSGTNLRSTSFANFSGSVAPVFTANDIVAVQLNAASSATVASFSIQCQ
jgi:hypothetical protein